MSKKYNLALLPMNQRQSIVTLASKFASVAGSYQLGEHSFPHVTLCKFFAEPSQIKTIWQSVSSIGTQPLRLSFAEFSYLQLKSNYWISLLPIETDTLHILNYQLHMLIHPGKLKQSYDPHMTLVNLNSEVYPQVLDEIKNEFTTFSDLFCLALGSNDEIGQFTEIMHV